MVEKTSGSFAWRFDLKQKFLIRFVFDIFYLIIFIKKYIIYEKK